MGAAASSVRAAVYRYRRADDHDARQRIAAVRECVRNAPQGEGELAGARCAQLVTELER